MRSKTPRPAWMIARGIDPTGTTASIPVSGSGLLEGPGTELKRILGEEFGVPPCQACNDLARRMNQWGPDGCRARLPQIVGEIKPRAEEWLAREGSPWSDRLKSLAPDFAKNHEIRKLVIRAIEAA